MMASEIDKEGRVILDAYERGKLRSVATKKELAKFKAAARATAIKDRRVNIRLSSNDLREIQARACRRIAVPDADRERLAQVRNGSARRALRAEWPTLVQLTDNQREEGTSAWRP